MIIRTITANKCYHHNHKYIEDRVQPQFNIAISAYKICKKWKYSIYQKLKHEALIINANSSYTTNISNNIDSLALQWFCNIK